MKKTLRRVKLAKEPVLKKVERWIIQDAKHGDRIDFAMTYPDAKFRANQLMLISGAKRVHVFKATYNFVEAFEAK